MDILDQIQIDGLQVFAHHGVFPEERERGQTFCLDATLYADLHRAGAEDLLEETTDYGAVCQTMTRAMQEQTFRLIEAAAEHTAREVLLHYPRIRKLELRVNKPEAPIPLPVESVAVMIRRGWQTAYVALGSNLGDRKQYLTTALQRLSEHPLVRVKKTSELIETAPYGGVEQDDFLNGVCEVETLLEPLELLHYLQKLEGEADRVRTVHWGPRTLDLDLLFYEDCVMQDTELTLPHPDLQNRDFVLRPMTEIAPQMRHPLLNRTMLQLWEGLQKRGTDCGS